MLYLEEVNGTARTAAIATTTAMVSNDSPKRQQNTEIHNVYNGERRDLDGRN